MPSSHGMRSRKKASFLNPPSGEMIATKMTKALQRTQITSHARFSMVGFCAAQGRKVKGRRVSRYTTL